MKIPPVSGIVFLTVSQFYCSGAVALPSLLSAVSNTFLTVQSQTRSLKIFGTDYFAVTNELDIKDWWKNAINLRGRARRYTDQLIREASADFSVPLDDFKAQALLVIERIKEFREAVSDSSSQLDREKLNEELNNSGLLVQIVDHLKNDFPPPEGAPSHEERVNMVKDTMKSIGEALVNICVEKFGAEESVVRNRWKAIEEAIIPLIVITGDLIEQHPVLAEILLISVAFLALPEVWLTQRLLGLFGFSPIGPVKGTTAAWLQKRFWGSAVAKESWFARLQAASMASVPGGRVRLIGSVFAGILAFSVSSCGGRS